MSDPLDSLGPLGAMARPTALLRPNQAPLGSGGKSDMGSLLAQLAAKAALMQQMGGGAGQEPVRATPYDPPGGMDAMSDPLINPMSGILDQMKKAGRAGMPLNRNPAVDAFDAVMADRGVAHRASGMVPRPRPDRI